VLPLSHDEVVYGKRSLISKMPGDRWQQFANLRLLFGFMWTHPGKKLLFMGGEFGQWKEWAHEGQLDWELAQWDEHAGCSAGFRTSTARTARSSPLHQLDFSGRRLPVGGQPRQRQQHPHLPAARPRPQAVLVAVQLHPRSCARTTASACRWAAAWREALNSDAPFYGGSGVGNQGRVVAAETPFHGREHSPLPSPAAARHGAVRAGGRCLNDARRDIREEVGPHAVIENVAPPVGRRCALAAKRARWATR
jgi:1,4-alpha-glucan branching enzyme